MKTAKAIAFLIIGFTVGGLVLHFVAPKPAPVETKEVVYQNGSIGKLEAVARQHKLGFDVGVSKYRFHYPYDEPAKCDASVENDRLTLKSTEATCEAAVVVLLDKLSCLGITQ